MPEQLVFISKPLKLDGMICLSLVGAKSTDASYSDFSLTTMRCRQLLFDLSPFVLASPVTDSSTVHVICPHSLASRPQFENLCRKLSLTPSSQLPLSGALLSECLSYTLTARLAPAWNRAGRWLLAGRQFLHQADQIPAVQMDLRLADQRLEFLIRATKVRFPLLQPDELGIGFETMKEFIEGGSEGCLSCEHFGKQSVVVLPKLSSASLVSVTRQLPEGSRFSQWAAMKRYWKNMYGYRLEAEDGSEPVVYYNVSFHGGPVLTYPEWTVRRAVPVPVPRTDPRPVADMFIQQIQKANTAVCGQPLSIEPLPSLPLVTAVRPTETLMSAAPCLQQGYPTPSTPYRPVSSTGPRRHDNQWTASQMCGEGKQVELSGPVSCPTPASKRTTSPEEDSGYLSCNETPAAVRIEPNTALASKADQTAAKKPTFLPRERSNLSSLHILEKPEDTSTDQARQKPLFLSKGNFFPQELNTGILAEKPSESVGQAESRPLAPLSGPTVRPCFKKKTETSFLSRLVASQTKASGDTATLPPPAPSLLSGLVTSRPCFTTTCTSRGAPAQNKIEGGAGPVRKRPAVQEVCVAQVARDKGAAGLGKINSATLLNFLRQQGNKAAKAKCKKEELVRLVLHSQMPSTNVSNVIGQ